MKKKLLLTILPALLVVSACNGGVQNNQQNNNEPEVSEEIFVEDTLAHEELFGGEAVTYKLGQPAGVQPRGAFLDRRLDDPDPLEEPSIGVQYLSYNDGGTDYYAIRYVAAITSLSVTATWTRDIADANGSRPRDGQPITVPVENAYSALSGVDPYGEEAPQYPSSVDAKYHYFVVFTLRKIPTNRVNSYLFGYLTLTSLNGASSVSTKARIAKVSNGNTWKFNLADVKGNYFMHGRIGGSDDQTVLMNDVPADGYYAKKAADSLVANDNFGIFKVGTDGEGNFSHFQFFGYESYRTAGANKTFPFVGRDFNTDFTKIVTAGNYVFNVKNNNTVEVTTTSDVQEHAKFYLIPGIWDDGNARFDIYVWNNSDQTKKEFVRGTLAVSGVYEFNINNWTTKGYDRAIFLRMDKNNPTDDWGSAVYNQTGDLTIQSDSNIYSINSWDGGDYGNSGGYWTIWF